MYPDTKDMQTLRSVKLLQNKQKITHLQSGCRKNVYNISHFTIMAFPKHIFKTYFVILLQDQDT